MNKRCRLWGLLLLTTLLALAGCSVADVVVNTTIDEGGSSSVTVLLDVELDPERGCQPIEGNPPLELVETANGPRCRSSETIAFDHIDELRGSFTDLEDNLVLSCVELVDGIFYLDSTIIPDDGTEEDLEELQGSTLTIIFNIPGEVSSSNADRVDGNTLVWSLSTETPVAPYPMLINMNTGDSCPPESPAGEGKNEEAEVPAGGESEEPAEEEEEVAMDAIAAKLPAGLDDLVLGRMGCTKEDVNIGDCRNQADAIGIAKQIDQDISDQLPNPEAAAGVLFYIHLVTTYAYSRDFKGELIFPSLKASLPVVIQLAWNSIDDPGQLQALYRYVAILINYDNQRYAADHGE